MNSIRLKTVPFCVYFLIHSSCLIAQVNDYPEGLHIYPYLQYATPTSIIIKWETIDPTIGTVTYSEDDSFGSKVIEASPKKIHEIELKGLKPATQYRYKVSYKNIVLQPAKFTTAPVPGTQNWSMVAYGDNRSHPEIHKGIAEQILKLNPSMIIHSGDLVEDGNNYDQWKTQYFDPMKGLAENITVFPSLGNHERNSPHYYEYMSVPDENGESYYSFDYGNAHFIALNSNAREAPFDLDSAQTQWLIKDLQKNSDAQWKIVFFHHPLFRCQVDRGIEPQRWVWHKVFEENGVDLVINGHDHYYQRTYAIANYKGEPSRGVYYLISGGGGAPNYGIIPKVHAANRRSVHHFTSLDFQGNRIVGRAIDEQGNIFDAFVYDQEAENSPEEFISYEIYEIERDLTNMIFNLPVGEFDNEVKINHSIEIKNPFQHPLKMTFEWEQSKKWITNATKTELLTPGNPIRIELSAKGNVKNMHPKPHAKLRFEKPDGEIAFKNNTITFYPIIGVSKRKNVEPKPINKLPKIDGEIEEKMWKEGDLYSDFIEVQGDSTLNKTELLVRFNKSSNTLYIAGKVQSSKEAASSGVSDHDNTRIWTTDDNVKICLSDESLSNIYTYATNAKGAILDFDKTGLRWNSTATSAAIPNKNGWQFELAIPLNELNIENKKTKIDFFRYDSDSDTISEYSPTFGKSPLDQRIPMFQFNWRAVDKYVELILK